MDPCHVVILAAGEGKRMRSRLPKVLHTIAGRPLLEHVIEAGRALGAARIHVVHGHGGESVRARLDAPDLTWVEQARQLGTGHAVAQAIPGVPDAAIVLVLYGDVPLVEPATLGEAVEAARGGALALVTVSLEDPAGYGRVLRDARGNVTAVVEERDADPSQRAVREINTGILAAPAARLRGWLDRIDDDNAQGEYYLTDAVGLAVDDGVPVVGIGARSPDEVAGVNDRVQLAHLERAFQRRSAERLMRAGVTVLDPARIDIRGVVEAGRDAVIDVNVVLEGRVVLGEGVRIGPNVVIRDAEVGAGTIVNANSVVEDAHIGRDCRIGPFARIRPGTRLAERVHVGNFVEIKATTIGEGSKANHLTYLGDSEIGRDVNVGAGTITCNYDGAAKHRTIIGDGAFIGSGVELVAPLTVHPGATIGAGTTLSADAAPDALTVARVKPRTLAGWKRPKKPK